MKSMNLIKRNCQELPDHERGVVFALDISKNTITYRACRPGKATKAYTVNQTIKGFRGIVSMMEEYKGEGYEVWVGYEPTGAYSSCIFEYLAERDWKVVQINPKHTSKFNDIMDNAPGKSDPRDPLGMAGLIWQGCYRTPVHLTGTYAELRAASSEWRMLAVESTRLRNQLHSLLALWSPEMGLVFKDVLCKSARCIIRKYSSADEIAKASIRSIRCILAKAGRTANRAQALLDTMRGSTCLKSGQMTRYKAILHHLERLELLERHKDQLKADMSALLSMLPESALLLSVKGIGVVISAIILGECGNIGDYGVKQLEKLLGLNLCEFSSGQYKGKRKISKCGRAGVRYALCIAATRMTSKGAIYHYLAEDMRAKGKKFGEIRVAVARKLLRLLHSLVSSNKSFDPQQFVAQRRTADDLQAHQDERVLIAA